MAQNFELGLIKDQDGDRSSMYSSCGSLSFVITDDADIEKIPEPSMANVDDPEKTSNGNVDKSLNGDVDKSLNGDVDKSSNCDADKTSNEMFSYMTQSQYAQVVFQDIADRYPNNRDLLCMYTLTGELESGDQDRIGLFRVPSFASHDYVAFKWVAVDGAGDSKKRSCSVIFEASSLPKDDDFYQFQYLRADQVFGASVPFQLRGGEELYAVEDEEFMRVDRETDVAHRSLIDKIGSLSSENEALKAQLEDVENKCKTLSSQFEEMKEDVKSKQESFVVLDEQYKSHQDSSTKTIEQLKMDFAYALQDKLVLEERLHKGQKAIKELQTDRDALSGQAHHLQREKRMLEEEMTSMLIRMEEDKNMFFATAKAKELAVQEIKNYILKNDEIQKRNDRLQRDLEVTNAQNENLKMVLDSLRTKFENLEMVKECEEKSKDLIIADLELKLVNLSNEKNSEIENLRNEVSLKQREFEVLSSELVTRSKSKFQQIDSLKKQLSDAERSLNKYMNGPTTGSGPASVASVLESLSQLEITDNDNDEDDEERSGTPLKTLEARIQALHFEFKKVEQSHAVEIRNIRDELESLRSNTMTQSYNSSASSNDSRRMLDSQVISNQIAMTSQIQQTENLDKESMASQTESVTSLERSISTRSVETLTSETCEPSAPALTEVAVVAPPLPPPRTKPVILAPPRFQVPAASSPPMSAECGSSRPENVFSNFFKNLIDQKTERFPGVQQQPSSDRLPEPLVPLKVDSQPASLQESTADDDFAALAAWARGCLLPKPKVEQHDNTSNSSSEGPSRNEPENISRTEVRDEVVAEVVAEVSEVEAATPPEIILTDDGRILEAPKEKLACPFCLKEYQRHEVERLELHVESHMDRTLTCPICESVFELKNADREEYQTHVQSHFPEDTDFVEVGRPSAPAAAPAAREDEHQPGQPRDRFWFLDFD